MVRVFLLIGIVIVITSSCRKDETEEMTNLGQGSIANCDSMILSYDIDIQPIIIGSCALLSCHFGPAPSGGIPFESYENAKYYAENGKLLCSIKWEAGCTPMPSGLGQLSLDNIRKIECWINNGTPE